MKNKAYLLLFLACLNLSPLAAQDSSAGANFMTGANFLGLDFLPSAVSRGGALSTAYENPTATYYNPANLPRLKGVQVELGIAAGIYPDMVYSEYVSLYFKTRTLPVYFSIYQQHSSVVAQAKNTDPQGEILASSLLFSVSTGGLFKSNGSLDLSWGATLKLLSSRQYIFTRNYLMADFGLLADFPDAHMRCSAGLRNFGFDLNGAVQLFGGTVTATNVNAANPISVMNTPLTLTLGYQYRFLKKFCAMVDLDYSLFESLNEAGLGAFHPKIALCFEPIPTLSFNVGRTFKDAPGLGYFTFGFDFNVAVDKSVLVLQYALEPIPYLGFNNYVRVCFQFP